MKWLDVINPAVVHLQRITQQAAIRGAPRAQLELLTPVVLPVQRIYGRGARIIGRR